MTLTALVFLVVTADPTGYSKLSESDGVLMEARPVAGSAFVELRLTTTTDKTVASLCDAAYGRGAFDKEEPDLKSRRILSEGEHERVTYDQISPPVVANRDYAVRATQTYDDDGSCTMRFAAANELAPPSPSGWVRIEKVSGSWRFEPTPSGKTRVVYTIHSDPAGAIPAFLVEGSRRAIALKWVRLILSRGSTAGPATPSPAPAAAPPSPAR